MPSGWLLSVTCRWCSASTCRHRASEGLQNPAAVGRVWENGSLWLQSEARDGETTGLPTQAKAPPGRILCAATFQPIDATYRPLPCCSPKVSQEHISISHGNLKNLHTFWLQPGRDSPGYRFPDGFKVEQWEVEVRTWRKLSSTHSPFHQAARGVWVRRL